MPLYCAHLVCAVFVAPPTVLGPKKGNVGQASNPSACMSLLLVTNVGRADTRGITAAPYCLEQVVPNISVPNQQNSGGRFLPTIPGGY